MSENIVTKTCGKCHQIKTVSDFYKNAFRKDGYSSWCKCCEKAYIKDYRKTPRGYQVRRRSLAKYNKSDKAKSVQEKYRRSDKYSNTAKAYQQKYYREYHERRIAMKAVTRAIQSGRLVRPDSLLCCCGKQAEQYHHHKGYASEHRLDVIPICPDCHAHFHRDYPTPI